MELDRLKQFYYVAREGNITKAAHYLNISQPALSRCISLFEHRMGCKLFIRYAKGIKLTSEGEKVYKFSAKVYEEINLLSKIVKANTLAGEITVALNPYLSSSWLIEKIKNFVSLYPDIHLKILNHFDMSHNQDIDVVIGFDELGTYDSISHVLLKSSIGLFASSSYLKKHGTPQELEDLDKHHLISYSEHHKLPYREKTPWALKIGRNYGDYRQPVLMVPNLDGLLNAACNNLGIIELPCGITEIKEKNLVPVLPQLKGPPIEIFFTYPQELKDRVNIQTLRKHLVKLLK